ncbi:acyltransferase [Rhodococcus sp. X156]|uniref:acyltransferase family protein n=1 Tax=Rhodococcus sp. X156 TaxID=2499145 RepID=UPI000FD6C5DE|nr:acyltransferase [Rhodococcus sp. X156]
MIDSSGSAADTRHALDRARKDLAIQSLRGLAVVLMVSGHIVGGHAEQGMQVDAGSLWHYFTVGLEDIRMPLFTLLSGLVYALRPVHTVQDYRRMVRGKSRRLLLPLLSVGTVLFALLFLVPWTNWTPALDDYWRVFAYGFKHLWFLQAIFLVFLVVAVLDLFGLLASVRRWQLATLAAMVTFVVVNLPPEADVFSINGALRLLPFFLLGYGMQRHGRLDARGWDAAVVSAMFVAAYGAKWLLLEDVWSPSELTRRTLSVIVGALGVVLVYSARQYLSSRLLAWIGGFSFAVYLLHVFGLSVSDTVLYLAGVDNHVVVFGLGLLVGVGGPILFQRVLERRWAWLLLVLLGERPRAPKPVQR